MRSPRGVRERVCIVLGEVAAADRRGGDAKRGAPHHCRSLPAGANCDPSAASCPTATLVADVARAGAEHPIHAAYIDGVRKQIETLAALGNSGDPARDRADACVRLATMMGALLLARATHGDPLSAEIAAAARARLTTDDAMRRPAPEARTRRTKAKGGAR